MLEVQVRRLGARWRGLRRDAAMVVAGLLGRHPSPLIRVHELGQRPDPAPAEQQPAAAVVEPPGPVAPSRSDAVAALAEPHPAEITAAGRTFHVTVSPGQTILEAGRAADVPLKFSCTVGGCGTCKSKLRRGQVDLGAPNCLTDEEVTAGYILPCVSRPLEAVTVDQ
ncbi:MAG: 2Fe-2S iron-sulfur cluster binding domain-containing protein [Deltaproteobacteria bacterium]|nr:2Fe-2S iron-sulfur cluster binding domain-containing protein [Deltaproteobacteria bacterium]